MTDLDILASELGASTRTLRRAAACRLIKARRSSPRRLVLEDGEWRYLRRHWPLLSKLRQALRTEPNIRLAVLFGSAALGTEHPGSDVDLCVSLAEDGALRLVDIGMRLERAIGREVQLTRLEDAREVPSLLADILRDGRVLVDRDGQWSDLKRRERQIRREAERYLEKLDRRAWQTLERVRAIDEGE